MADSKQQTSKWKIEYDNDTGFWEWWIVTDGDKAFRCGEQSDAEWLCNLLNLST